MISCPPFPAFTVFAIWDFPFILWSCILSDAKIYCTWFVLLDIPTCWNKAFSIVFNICIVLCIWSLLDWRCNVFVCWNIVIFIWPRSLFDLLTFFWIPMGVTIANFDLFYRNLDQLRLTKGRYIVILLDRRNLSLILTSTYGSLRLLCVISITLFLYLIG